MKIKSGLYLILLMVVLLSCNESFDFEAEKAGVKSTIDKHLLANETENLDLYISSWAKDDDMINLGMSGERWIGWKELHKHAEESYELFDNIQFSTRDLVINLDGLGETAWFSCYLDFSGTSHEDTVSITGARFTGVLKKDENKWVYVQTHASLVQVSE